MRSQPPVQVEFVTDEYAEKLDRFAESRTVSREAAEKAYITHCEELQGTLQDDTPGDVLRRIAYHKLEWNAE